jgi:hypothetical protein
MPVAKQKRSKGMSTPATDSVADPFATVHLLLSKRTVLLKCAFLSSQQHVYGTKVRGSGGCFHVRMTVKFTTFEL